MTPYEIARDHMIEGQIKPNQVTDARLLDALRAIPRESFVPQHLKGVAYVDEDLEVASGRYLMEPMVLARLLDAADLKASDVALEVGTASGYAAAVMSQLVGAVVALEENEDLANRAGQLMGDVGCESVAVVKGPLTAGWAAQAPYDVILINGLVEHVPAALLDQLAEDGRLVTVQAVGGVGKAVLYRKENGVIGSKELFDAMVAPLPGFEQPQQFVF